MYQDPARLWLTAFNYPPGIIVHSVINAFISGSLISIIEAPEMQARFAVLAV
ncbi:hypothetical protein [Prosthecobacter sp.]|uniref:hypothetical protein n=1 Tax=Prosthecobacter sp. TaxID=1965333 RepID=UPI003783D58A